MLDGVAEVNDLAGFDLAFTLPDNVNLGYTYLQLIAQGLPDVWGGQSGIGPARYPTLTTGWQYEHSFQVQEFRRPEFEVSAATSPRAPTSWAMRPRCRSTATYYAGGPLPNAETSGR